MDQDQRLDAIIERIGRVEALQENAVPPELAKPKSFLKVLRATHRNWSSERFRKIFGMRFSVKIPPLEQINAIFYPQPNYDIPVFIFFCLITRRKVIAHLNFNCTFADAAYRQQWVEPLVEIRNRYPSFESDDRYPEWMLKYRNEATIYGLFPRDRLDDLSNCCFEYLDYYSDQVAQAQPVTDPARLQQIAQFQDKWVDDIRTQDKAQSMIAKMIDKTTRAHVIALF